MSGILNGVDRAVWNPATDARIAARYNERDIAGKRACRDALRAALTSDTALVSVMHANNEIGTIQPIAAMAGLALSLFVPRRRLWVRTTTAHHGGTVLEVAGLARGDDPRLQPTVDTLATRLTPSPAPLRGGSDDPVP